MSRRYVLVRIVSDHTVTEEQFGGALMAAVRRSFGEIGLARIGPRIVKFDTATLLTVIACKQEMVAELEAAVALIPSCGGGSVTPLVIQVSGTIKGLHWRRMKSHC